MIRAKYFFCAESAAVDSVRNTLSAFHILEEAQVQSFPFVFPRISVIGSFTREQTDHDRANLTLSVRIGEHQIYNGPFRIAFFQRLSARALFELQGIAIIGPGELIVRLLDEEREVAVFSIPISGGTQTQGVMVFNAPPQPQEHETEPTTREG